MSSKLFQFLFLGACTLAHPVFGAPILFKVGAVGLVQSAVDGQFYFSEDTTSSGSQAAAQLNRDNINTAASTNIQSGEMKVLSTGALANDYGSFQSSAASFLVDTITASGSLGGLNLGMTLSISGTTNSSDILANNNFLLIGIYNRGHLDAAEKNLLDFYDSQYRLWGAAYSLGSHSNMSPNIAGYQYAGITGHYGDGAHQVPLTIPFAVVGSEFEIHMILISSQGGNSVTLQTWNNDFSHTVGVELSADPGVTLTSASGLLPGTESAIPEPSSAVLIPGALGLLFCLRLRLKANRSI